MSGGPLRAIADDDARGAGARALAQSMIDFMQQRQSLHGKPLPLDVEPQLSFAQVKLLFHLPLDGTSLPLGRYAESIGITPAALTQALGPIENAGLVRRERSDTDRRIVHAQLTEQGMRTLDALRAGFGERWDASLATFDDDELAVAARVLASAAAMFRPVEG